MHYRKGGFSREGSCISKTYLRKVQGHQKKGFRYDYLRESKTQAETGLIFVSVLHVLCAAAA